MPVANGNESKMAVKKGTAWGTAVAVGAGNGVIFGSHGIKRTQAVFTSDEMGAPYATSVALGAIACAGPLEMPLKYDSLDLLLALFMGTTGGAPTRQGATAAYAQKFSLAGSIVGKFATLCVNNGIGIDEFTSIKVNGMTLKGAAGQDVRVSFDITAQNLSTGSTTNTIATFNTNVTFPAYGNNVLFEDGVFRINLQSGIALASGDIVYPSDFELAVKRTVEGAPWVGGANTIDEPGNAGMLKTDLTLTFARYLDNSHDLAWIAQTAYKMDMTFTGALIESTYYRKFIVALPQLIINDPAHDIVKGPIKEVVKYTALGVDTAPTGMTATAPIEISVVNKQTADVLA